MRLVWVELRRLFARRFFTIGVSALLLALGAVLAITAWQSQLPTAAQLEKARAAAVAAQPGTQAERERCEQAQLAGGDAGYPQGVDCTTILAPTAETFVESTPFVFDQQVGDRTHGVSAVLTLFAFLLGATVVGAEWQHGTMTGLLLWEPRRVRVFVAKLAALFTSVALTGIVAYALNYGGLWLIARFRGRLGDVTAELHQITALTAGRGLALALVSGAIGFAIAFAFRHTVAAAAFALAYFAVFELGVRSFVPSASTWLATTYMSAWIEKGARVTYPTCASGDCADAVFNVPMWGGGAYLLGLGLVTLVAAVLVFRRSEVA